MAISHRDNNDNHKHRRAAAENRATRSARGTSGNQSKDLESSRNAPGGEWSENEEKNRNRTILRLDLLGRAIRHAVRDRFNFMLITRNLLSFSLSLSLALA